MITREQTLSHFSVLYADDDAKDGSAIGGRLSSSECAEQGLCSRAVTVYGEVSPSHWEDLLRVAEQAGSSVEHHEDRGSAFRTFWDIGSGTGKACFLAAMSGRFEACAGLEVLSSLHARATTVLNERWPQVRDAIQNQAAAVSASPPASVVFHQADLRDARRWGRHWLTSSAGEKLQPGRASAEPAAEAAAGEGAVLVFANCTMFDPALMEALAAAVRNAPRGSVFLSFTKPLPGSCDCSSESRSTGSARAGTREDCACGAKEYECEHVLECGSGAGALAKHTCQAHSPLDPESSARRRVWLIVDEFESEASWGCVSVFVHVRVEW